MSDLLARRVPVEAVLPLRHEVLRPGFPFEMSRFDGDERGVHVAVSRGDEVVAVATVLPDPWIGTGEEDSAPNPYAWRLRGVASSAAVRGLGAGRLAVDEAVAAAREAGAPIIWANARMEALGFYERLGWTVVGNVFPSGPAKIPHRVILLATPH